MIKELCNLIGKEQILVYKLKMCTLNCCKNTFIYLIFHSKLPLIKLSNAPKTTQREP